jgi:hypothetical protein
VDIDPTISLEVGGSSICAVGRADVIYYVFLYSFYLLEACMFSGISEEVLLSATFSHTFYLGLHCLISLFSRAFSTILLRVPRVHLMEVGL